MFKEWNYIMIDLEDKRIKIAVILLAIVGFLIYYFYPKDELPITHWVSSIKSIIIYD
jgi:hypothetical protein